MEVLGEANSNATVTLWTQDAGGTPGQPGDPPGFFRTIRKNDYFRGEVSFNNNTGAVWMNITNIAVLTNGTSPDIISTNIGGMIAAKTPELFQYDADGNLTNDGLFSYSWDAENRLINITSPLSAPTNGAVQETWSYLPDGCWSQVVVSAWGGPGYSPVSTNRFLWDGQVLAAEAGPNNSLIRSYLRGTDLSGTTQGAGGVGGLLEVSYYGTVTTNCFVAYDGNGNVAALVNGADGTVAANYEYDPFGQTIRQTGPMASANPMRFSTQWADDNLKDIKYLYRTYSASVGMWASRDPLTESAGANIYGFVANTPLNAFDVTGLKIKGCIDKYLDDLQLQADVDYSKDKNGVYTALRDVQVSDLNNFSKFVVIRMMLSSFTFQLAGTSEADNEANLKKHINARNTIVNNTLNSVVGFGHNPAILVPSPNNAPDPQAYYDSLNVATTDIGCHKWSLIIFQTGNKYNPPGNRPLDGVWIPGDWGYIKNINFTRGTWFDGLQGENVIYVGNDSFWGLFDSGLQPGHPEEWWFNTEIPSWTDNKKTAHGSAKWDNPNPFGSSSPGITYPSVGLQ